MRLVELMDERAIDLELNQESREEVIEALVGKLGDTGRITQTERVLDAVLERERALSTGVGQGVAVPHATVDGLGGAVVSFGRHTAGVEFGALDEKPVRLIFLLLAPAEEISLHLKLLSRVSRLCNRPEFRDALLEAPDSAAVIETIREHETSLKEL